MTITMNDRHYTKDNGTYTMTTIGQNNLTTISANEFNWALDLYNKISKVDRGHNLTVNGATYLVWTSFDLRCTRAMDLSTGEVKNLTLTPDEIKAHHSPYLKSDKDIKNYLLKI